MLLKTSILSMILVLIGAGVYAETQIPLNGTLYPVSSKDKLLNTVIKPVSLGPILNDLPKPQPIKSRALFLSSKIDIFA